MSAQIASCEVDYTMALSQSEQTLVWNLGSQCTLFIRNERKWADGEIVGSFSDEHGKWVKVRCGDQVHEVLNDDPDLKPKSESLAVVPVDDIKRLRTAAMEQPIIAQWLHTILSSSAHSNLQYALDANTKSSDNDYLCFKNELISCHPFT